MTVPFDLLDVGAMDLTSELGQENALTAAITSLNSVLALLNSAGSTVPLLGTGNSGGLLTASQKLTLTGGPTSNADGLHTHTGGGIGGSGTAGFLLSALDATVASGRALVGVAGEIVLNDSGAGANLSVGLAPSGAVAGSYAKVTVDTRGRVVNGGGLVAGDLPAHQHSAADLTSGFIPAGRYQNKTIPTSAINPNVLIDGWIMQIVGGFAAFAAPPSGLGEANTASNVGTGGLGLFKQKTGPNLEFYGIKGAVGLIGSLDVPNNNVNLVVDFGTNTNQAARGDHVHDTRYYQKSEVDNLVKVLSVVTKTGAYVATAADQYIRGDASGGGFNITLPDAGTNIGKVLRIKRINSGPNTVNIVPAGTDKIDIIWVNWTLWDRNEYVVFVAAVGGWEVIDASGSTVVQPGGNIGSSFAFQVNPTHASLALTATVNNGTVLLSGMTPNQTAHVELHSGGGGFLTVFGATGQGLVRWPGGSQPATTTSANKIDDFYATFNGTDTLCSFRGQGY